MPKSILLTKHFLNYISKKFHHNLKMQILLLRELFRVVRFHCPNFFNYGICQFKVLQYLLCFFMPFSTVRIGESIGRSILFRNLLLTISMLLNKRSTSAFELGRINRLIANVAISLNGFSPEASL